MESLPFAYFMTVGLAPPMEGGRFQANDHFNARPQDRAEKKRERCRLRLPMMRFTDFSGSSGTKSARKSLSLLAVGEEICPHPPPRPPGTACPYSSDPCYPCSSPRPLDLLRLG